MIRWEILSVAATKKIAVPGKNIAAKKLVFCCYPHNTNTNDRVVAEGNVAARQGMTTPTRVSVSSSYKLANRKCYTSFSATIHVRPLIVKKHSSIDPDDSPRPKY